MVTVNNSFLPDNLLQNKTILPFIANLALTDTGDQKGLKLIHRCRHKWTTYRLSSYLVCMSLRESLRESLHKNIKKKLRV